MSETIFVHVTPKSSKNEVIGWKEGVLHLKVTAVPDKGKANEAVIKLLSKHFHLRASEIEVLSGHTSRKKKIRLPQSHCINVPSQSSASS